MEIVEYYKEKDGTAFNLVSVNVMPNHIHLLVRQKEALSAVVQIAKGGAARIVNRRLGREGSVWSRDYFDRAIRDERHFHVTYEYIKHNGVKAKLEDAWMRYYGVYG